MKHLTRTAFTTKQLLRPAAAIKYRKLSARQNWSTTKLNDFSQQKMREIVEHAIRTSPFYAEHLPAGSGDNLNTLPVLTRQHLSDHFDDICSRNIRKNRGLIATTGGTTGTPLRIMRDKANRPETIKWRVLQTWGVHPGDDVAMINRQHRTLGSELLNRLMWFPTRRALLNVDNDMTADAMRQFTERIIKIRPRILVGYAGALLAYADYLEAEGFTIPALDVVWVTASPLTDAERSYLSRVFGGPLFDQYGSAEISWIAAECRYHTGLHVQSDCVFVEVLDERGDPVQPGTWGRIVLTDLQNYVFPLIRYEIGDVGRFLPGDCACGSPFPRLDHIQGRTVDVIRFRDGSIVFVPAAHIFNNIPGAVRQFRLHQVSLDDIIVYCIPSNWGSETLEIIERESQKFQSLIGDRARVELRMVDKLDHDRGKIQLVVSDVRPERRPN